jgi:serine/threonine-protein kinase RsbT
VPTMAAELRVPVGQDADIVAARQQGRALAEQSGFSGSDLTVIATAISEVARNIVSYADRGEIVFRVLDEDGRRAIVVTATDEGPGIADVALAMQDGYSTGSSLGLGLPGSRRLMDEFEIASELGRGTTITMKKWVR